MKNVLKYFKLEKCPKTKALFVEFERIWTLLRSHKKTNTNGTSVNTTYNNINVHFSIGDLRRDQTD